MVAALYDTSALNVSLISNALPIFDEICRRTMNFLHSCLYSESDLIRHVVFFGITVSRMNSVVGRNASFCCDRYRKHLDNIGRIGDSKISGRVLFGCLKSDIQPQMVAQADVLHEAILVRDGLLRLPSYSFTTDEILFLIDSIAK